MTPLRILIVDDHESIRRGIRSLLSSRSEWSVCGEAIDGQDAIEKAKELRPDVILMDVSMPVMDGMEATRIIKKSMPDADIILVTQNDVVVARQKAAAVNARGFVAKTTLAKDLLPEIDRVIEGRHLSAAPLESLPRNAKLGWMPGGGDLGQRIREFDWSKTPLGPIDGWPQSLKTVVNVLVSSRFAMWMGWGPELTFLYNDTYGKVTLGKKHPWALGKPSHEVWAEIWDDIGPRIHKVLETGQATWDEALLLFLERSGYREETYHTFSYSPLTGDDGAIAGNFCVVTEETDRIIGERRLKTLRTLATELSAAISEQDLLASVSRCLSANQQDLPFTLTYVLSDDGSYARLACRTGIEVGHPAAPETIDLTSENQTWPLGDLLNRRSSILVEDLSSRFDSVPSGSWQDAPTRALLVPITSQGQDMAAGVLVAALNPYRPLDAVYKGFIELTAGQIAASIANARAYDHERKRAEALAEIDRAKTSFFSNVSHEFRTPLTLMLGPLQDLLSRSRTHLSPTAKEQLELANRNGARLLRLVNTLLDFSRIEAGRVQAVYQATDLATFTSELASVFRSATERAGLRLAVDCQFLSEPAYVDRDMWEKIVLNLVSNALKFTFDGEISVRLDEVGHNAELRVADTGVGIPSDEIPRLFERFHRVPNTRSRTHEGSGIGLALVHELVKLHGGSMRVESTLGKGSAFVVTIPLGRDHLSGGKISRERTLQSTATGAGPFVEEALRWLPDETAAMGNADVTSMYELMAVPSPPSPVDSGQPRPRVLVADDNADMLAYLTRLLAERYDVESVANGQAALDAARRKVPDLILSDVMMPELDGFALLHELRSDSTTQTIPFILLSARAGEESRVEGLDAGADDYLVKPFSARELIARVQTHLELARVRQESHRALRENEEKFRALVTASSDAIYRMNPDWSEVRQLPGKDVVANAEEPAVDWLQKYIPSEDQPHVQAMIEQAIRTKSVFELEHRVRRENGELGWICSRAVPILDESGQLVEWLGTASDVTARKSAEAELKTAQASLEARVQQRTEELERAQSNLRDLAGQLVQLQDEERRRIARELHDSAGQTLAVLSMNLALLSDFAKKGDTRLCAKADETQDLVQRLTREIRTTSYLLHPPLLDENGLGPALKWYIEGFEDRSHITVQLDIADDFARLPKEIELAVFRIVQESLTNILRHSGSERADIRISSKDNCLFLRVQDYGRGMPGDRLTAIQEGGAGVGTRGMRDRVRQVGGQFHVESSRAGTIVSITLPVSSVAKDKDQQTPQQVEVA